MYLKKLMIYCTFLSVSLTQCPFKVHLSLSMPLNTRFRDSKRFSLIGSFYMD